MKTTFPGKLGTFDKIGTLKIGIKPADVYSSLRAFFLINLDWNKKEKCKHRCSIEIFNTLNQGSSPNFASNIKEIQANYITYIAPEIIENLWVFFMISGGKKLINSLKFAPQKQNLEAIPLVL